MKEILIDEILVEGKNIEIEKVKSKFDTRELKAIFLLYYDKKRIAFREEISIKTNKKQQLIENDEVVLKISSRTIIGKGKIISIDNDNDYLKIKPTRLYIGSGEYSDSPLGIARIFSNGELKERNLKYDIKDEKVIKDKYFKGLFKIYYQELKYSIQYFCEDMEAKQNALCSYLAIRDVFKDFGFILSNPNSFIIDHKLEYDALLLKKESNEYFFEQNDLFASIEIKTSGIFFSLASLESDFKKYITEQHDGLDIPHIYIAIHEFSSNNPSDNETRMYDTCYNVIKRLGCIGIFCAVKNNNDQFIIPVDYDLEEILKSIK